MIIYRNIEVRTILAITLVAIGCQAAEPDESLGELQHFLDEVVESGTAGVSLRVAHGDAHWSGVAGVSNVEHQVDLQPGDSFPIFSVTKTFTAVVTLQLIDEGRLSFDDTLGALLAGTRHGEDIERIPHGGDATIRQLLNYSSGFYDYGNSMEFLLETVGTDADFSKRWSIDELLSFAQDEKNAPTGTPGSTFSYTSTGYLLLGLVIEEIEKEPLEDVLARRLFQPLRLSHTYLADYTAWRAPDVTGYVLTNPDMLKMGLAGGFPLADGNLVNTTPGERARLSAGRGENGIVSNGASLMRFAGALFDGDLLPPELLGEMVTPQDKVAAASGESVHNYGMGLHLFDYGDQVWAMMMGDGAGGEAAVGRELKSGLTFVVLTNTFGTGVSERTMDKMRSLVQRLD